MIVASLGRPGSHFLDLALVIMRLSLGLTVFAHGYRHIYGGGKIKGTAGWFESLGMKPGIMHAWLASLTEIGAGAMLVVGLLTPIAAGAVMGTLLVALITNHWKNGFWIFNKGEGYEYVLMIVCMSLALGTIGAGRYSLDKALKYPIAEGSRVAFLITAILGIGSALAIVGLFWRPSKTES